MQAAPSSAARCRADGEMASTRISTYECGAPASSDPLAHGNDGPPNGQLAGCAPPARCVSSPAGSQSRAALCGRSRPGGFVATQPDSKNSRIAGNRIAGNPSGVAADGGAASDAQPRLAYDDLRQWLDEARR